MDSIAGTERHLPIKVVKLITCILNSENGEGELLHALYEEKQITRAHSIKCRGYASLFDAKTVGDELPEPRFARMIEVIVPETEADEAFDFIYEKAGLGKPGAGVVYMTPLLGASSFSLPRDVPLEI
ncbi:TPA: hypothetical protein EYP38_01220 [Candidatus Micrarchaeota archaeon]|nr:hypothetical protein [Candidatus Micrarchaeota archaeon]